MRAGYILAFDYGLKRIGIAIGNTLTATATSLTTMTQTDKGPDWREVDEMISNWEPDSLLLGLPQDNTNSGKLLCDKIKKFGQQLQTRYDLPLSYIDESLPSIEAEAALKQARQSGHRKRIQKTDIDQQEHKTPHRAVRYYLAPLYSHVMG